MFKDDQTALKTDEGQGCQRNKMKHLGRKNAFLNEAIKRQELVMVYIPLEDNIADLKASGTRHVDVQQKERFQCALNCCMQERLCRCLCP
jgi:hypothetical protein